MAANVVAVGAPANAADAAAWVEADDDDNEDDDDEEVDEEGGDANRCGLRATAEGRTTRGSGTVRSAKLN